MPRKTTVGRPVKSNMKINLIDVGAQAYADCVLCQFGDINVLIDGAHAVNAEPSLGHRSIPDQLAELLSQPADSLHVDLLIVSHTHSDHYGCLPTLVGQNTLKADWALIADAKLGWGVVAGETDSLLDAADPRVRRLMDVFREDFPPDDDVRPLSDFALDRVSDQDVYAKFVSDLANGGSSVVSYSGGPEAGDLQKLLDNFRGKGLGISILGPSRAQLLECARGLAQGLGIVSDFLHRNSPSPSTDAVADFSAVLEDARNTLARGGNFVNLQSLVTIFEYQGKKFLFSGDMQTEDPTSKFSNIPISSILKNELTALRDQITKSVPYDFVKLGHHGSFNACSEQLMNAYRDTKHYGITVGEYSATHPDPDKVLPLLAARTDTIQWLRTDYNRLCGYKFDSGGNSNPFKETGQLNDPEKNKFDKGERLANAGGGSSDVLAATDSSAPDSALVPSTAKIQTKIPFAGGMIDFQLSVTTTGRTALKLDDVKRAGSTTSASAQPSTALPTPSIKGPVLAAGRTLPKLLFVTSADQLTNNVGKIEAQLALDAIRKGGHEVIDDLPAGLKLSDTGSTIDQVRQRLAAVKGVQGVVLLGGYDVVPSRQLNTLPPGEEGHVANIDDPDRWIVWCDDEYGCLQNDGKVQYYALPVSRVPDQHYAPFFFNTLEVPSTQGTRCSGIRNLLRPFASKISPNFKDKAPLYLSFPTTFADNYDLSAEYVYFMLHGDAINSREYIGETQGGQSVQAFRIDKVPSVAGCVVLAGCCWAALTSATPAVYAAPDQPIGLKGRDESIALRFLANGARAFVGCTGAHYSPDASQPTAAAGGSMHINFWKYCLDPSVSGPAEALRRSKVDYLKGMPYLPQVASSLTVDSKILNEFTCLGLGW